MQCICNYMGHCNCKGNCETLARCACRVAGRRCTSLYHGGKGNNKLCGVCDNLEEWSNDEDEESRKEGVTPTAAV